MSNHNIPQENKQSRLMDVVDDIDDRFPNLGKHAKQFGGAVLALSLVGGGALAFNELGPRTPVDEQRVDVGSLNYSTARSIVLSKTEKLADEHGIDIKDIGGVNDTTSALLHEDGKGNVELLKKPFSGYVVSAEINSSDPANIPAQPDQQNK
jgi:hypothetical protein